MDSRPVDSGSDHAVEPVTIKTGDILKPLERAATDGIDVLNVSGGWAHDHTREDCIVSDVIADLGSNAPLIVAAAGNTSDGRVTTEAVNCPGLIDHGGVIAVGGCEILCPAGPHTDAPEGNLWIDMATIGVGPDVISRSYCSFLGCDNFNDCHEDRIEQLWDFNVRPTDDKPDVYAPVAYVHEINHGGKACLVPGTSFAAPIVSGMITTILSNLETWPSNDELRQVVRESAVPMRRKESSNRVQAMTKWLASGTQPRRFDMKRAWDTFSTEDFEAI